MDTTCLHCKERPLAPRKNAASCGDPECVRKASAYGRDPDAHRAKMRAYIAKRRSSGIETERMEDRTCESCGKAFRGRVRSDARFCSRRCAVAQQDMAAKSRLAVEACRASGPRPCENCEQGFTGTTRARYCSPLCRYVARYGASCRIVRKRCSECGHEFTHDARVERKRCGVECKDAAFYRKRKRPWRTLATQVHARDRFTCWLCGEGTSPTWSKSDPLSPTLDHVIPRSMGGGDSIDNLRTAHWVCNSVRGNAMDVKPFDLGEVIARTRWAPAACE